MRLDRFITLNCVRPFHRLFEAGCSILDVRSYTVPSLPILMYHSISEDAQTGLSPYYRTCTAPKTFAQHLAALKSAGYRGVDLATGLAWLNVSASSAFQEGNAVAVPPSANTALRPVVLTFDDGFRDFHTNAVPLLSEFGFKASIFLASNFIQDVGRLIQGREYMSWSDVLEAVKLGMHVGAHTASHSDLYQLPWSKVETELRDGRTCLEDHLGTSVSSIAYPYGFPAGDKVFCHRLRSTLIALGYQNCLTTIIRRVHLGDDLFTLPRLPVNGATDPPLLLAKVSGCYDWMRLPQLVSKDFNRMLANSWPNKFSNHSIKTE